jgi:iron complex transport system substrate-binding protein
MKTGRRRLLVVPLVALLVLAACGSDDDGAKDAKAAGTTTTTASTELDHIVSISPTATEILFAIGAGDQVVAVDDQSNYPTDAPKTELTSYQPNVEAIAKYDPDLVVSSSDDPDLVDGLDKLGIPVLVQKAAVEVTDVYTQIRQLGKTTGHVKEATSLVHDMRSEIDAISEKAKDRAALSAYWELDPTYYSVTSQTFIGKLLGLANVTTIADKAQSDVKDYPQLSSEFIVSADPDLVLLADSKCCDQTAASVGARAGWTGMKAVTTGNVVAIDDDIASRWGPRIVELLKLVDAAAEKAAS